MTATPETVPITVMYDWESGRVPLPGRAILKMAGVCTPARVTIVGIVVLVGEGGER